MINVDEVERRAQQLLAFANGYEEATTLLIAALVDSTGIAHDTSSLARQLRVVAFDMIEMAGELRTYRAVIAERNGQPNLWEVT